MYNINIYFYRQRMEFVVCWTCMKDFFYLFLQNRHICEKERDTTVIQTHAAILDLYEILDKRNYLNVISSRLLYAERNYIGVFNRKEYYIRSIIFFNNYFFVDASYGIYSLHFFLLWKTHTFSKTIFV